MIFAYIIKINFIRNFYCLFTNPCYTVSMSSRATAMATQKTTH